MERGSIGGFSVALGLALPVVAACSAGPGGVPERKNASGGAAGTAATGGTGGTGGVGGSGVGGSGVGGTGIGIGGAPDAGTGLMDGGECEGISQQAENTIRPVDIIWAFDTSPSMSGAINAVAARLNDMVVTVNNAGIDVRVVIIAEAGNVCVQPPFGGPSCGSNEPGYLHLTQCPTNCWVGSHNALGRLTGAYMSYKHVLRQSSVKYFGVVTDDTADDTNNYAVPAQQFTDRVNNLDPGWFDVWKFFGIFDMPRGTAYKMLVDQTGGTWTEFIGSATDYNKVFMDLTQTVTSSVELDCEWEIPPPPPGETFASNLVNVKWTSGAGVETELKKVASATDCAGAPDGGWYYDDELDPKKVLVCPQNCGQLKADLMAKVDILFGCETIVVPK